MSPAPRGLVIPPPPPNSAALAHDVGLDPSKLAGVMIVDGKTASETRSQAEQLAVRCNGVVITAPQSKDFTGQVFFVEVPREYAATFTLEMSRMSKSSGTTDVAVARDESGVLTSGGAGSAASTSTLGGVLTGGRNTNTLIARPARIAMENTLDSETSSTVILEIVVVPPKKSTP